MTWLGIDIGGANLKLADGLGYAESRPFALWAEADGLTQQLRTLIAQAPDASHLAVTMTGELADCYRSKEEGVRAILEAVERAADGRHTRVYLTTGQMVTPQVARRRTAEVAAANWHALATFAGRFTEGKPSLLVDVGSTTTDIIPLAGTRVMAQGRDDTSRLMAHELVYLGIERTPVCGLVDTLPYRDAACPIAREYFATTADAFLILNELPEDRAYRMTADGEPATKACARVRLGRMICADAAIFNHRDAVAIAKAIGEAVMEPVVEAMRIVLARQGEAVENVVISGAGEFLARRAVSKVDPELAIISLAQRTDLLRSRCGPAHALAVLAREAGSR